MAMLESAVVIYLRELLYPNGFQFPMVSMRPIVILTELARELATIVMLWTISYIAGRNLSTRFAWFLIGFAIWDIFYYVFLYLFIQWPVSIFEWDILFLIPLPWYGPVISPVIISLCMILLGYYLLKFDALNINIKYPLKHLIPILLGCGITLWTYMGDFILTLNQSQYSNISTQIIIHSQEFVPTIYPYVLFVISIGLIGFGIIGFAKEQKY